MGFTIITTTMIILSWAVSLLNPCPQEWLSSIQSVSPSDVPTRLPSLQPSENSSGTPSGGPLVVSSGVPSELPSLRPLEHPMLDPSYLPSSIPSELRQACPQVFHQGHHQDCRRCCHRLDHTTIFCNHDLRRIDVFVDLPVPQDTVQSTMEGYHASVFSPITRRRRGKPSP